jgi:hypothetical protein
MKFLKRLARRIKTTLFYKSFEQDLDEDCNQDCCCEYNILHNEIHIIKEQLKKIENLYPDISNLSQELKRIHEKVNGIGEYLINTPSQDDYNQQLVDMIKHVLRGYISNNIRKDIKAGAVKKRGRPKKSE